jgi:hypothetical protein
MAQPPEKPSLDDEHRLLGFCFIPRTSRPRWQNGSLIMRRHLGVGSIDLRVVETSLDNSGLGIVRHQQMRNAAEHLESADMGVDPVGQRPIIPGRLRRNPQGNSAIRQIRLVSAITAPPIKMSNYKQKTT